MSKNLKTNILKEHLNKKISNNFFINQASINSKDLKKNNIFFGIKGKNIDGNKFADVALKKKASICILEKNYSKKFTKIFVKDTLKTFSNLSCVIRKSLGTPIVAITGSAGKTSLKELIGQSLNILTPTLYSKNHLIINMEFHCHYLILIRNIKLECLKLEWIRKVKFISCLI